MNCFLSGSCFLTGVFIPSFLTWYFTPGGHSLIKVTGGLTLRILPGVVQQLKLLPRVDKTSHFCNLERKNLNIVPSGCT